MIQYYSILFNRVLSPPPRAGCCEEAVQISQGCGEDARPARFSQRPSGCICKHLRIAEDDAGGRFESGNLKHATFVPDPCAFDAPEGSGAVEGSAWAADRAEL